MTIPKYWLINFLIELTKSSVLFLMVIFIPIFNFFRKEFIFFVFLRCLM